MHCQIQLLLLPSFAYLYLFLFLLQGNEEHTFVISKDCTFRDMDLAYHMSGKI